MKRLISFLLICALLPLPALAREALPREVTLAAGETLEFDLPFEGYWDSDAPDVAEGAGNMITAYQEGWALLSLTSPEGDEWSVEVQVTAPEDAVPPLIRSVIDIALNEWQEAGGKSFPRSGNSKPSKDNKYTKWWGYDVGWCGVFIAYCMEKAGVPMAQEGQEKKLKPLGNGDPYSIRVGGVGRYHEAFTHMDRVTNIPRPGYLVIYNWRDTGSYIHIGMVTDVIDRGDGIYQIFTVEGNVSSRIKRFSYLYDSNNTKQRNMSVLPAEEQTDPATYTYTLHQKTVYILEFCQTWY